MISSVFNISQCQFKQFIPTKNHAFISIKDSSDSFIVSEEEKHNWLNGLSLVFDDVDDQTKDNFVVISKEQCQEIISFVSNLQESSLPIVLIIHCFAGISRSAAVGKWVNDSFKLFLPNYKNNSMIYNRQVYSLLNKTFYGLDY